MNTLTEFQVGDKVRSNGSLNIYEVVEVGSSGCMKFKGYEDHGAIYSPFYFTLHKEAKPPKWKIESDGSAYGTFLWIDGEEVRGIVDLDFRAGVDKTPTLQLTMVHDPGYK